MDIPNDPTNELAKQKERNLAPFHSEPKKLKDQWDLDKILRDTFKEEAKRFGLSPERYEYSCINTIYTVTNPDLETKYTIYDPGDSMLRGIIGNALGKALKDVSQVDLGALFEKTQFTFQEVLFRLPRVDVDGYGHFHTFLNQLNSRLKDHNLLVGYMRYDNGVSFRHGFYDLLGLIEGVPGKGLGRIEAGEVEMCPIQEIEEDKLYAVDVKGGQLLMAPIAVCNWNLNDIEGLTPRRIKRLSVEELTDLPMMDGMEDTFHYLNGVTPHYFRDQLTNAFGRIREASKPKDK